MHVYPNLKTSKSVSMKGDHPPYFKEKLFLNCNQANKVYSSY